MLLAHHPQAEEHEQREELRRVLGQSAVTYLCVSELTLDHSERVLHLGTDVSLELLDSIHDRIQCIALVQCSAHSPSHGHMPVDIHALRLFSLANPLVVGICIDACLVSMQQGMGLGDVIDVGSSADHRMNQTELGAGADVGFHSMVPLISFLCLVHFRVPFATAVLGGTGCSDDGGIDDGAAVQHESAWPKHGIDGLEELLGQIVFFQQVAETQDADPIRQPSVFFHSGKRAVQRRLEQGLFHGDVTQVKELLEQVQAQHGLVRNGGRPVALGGATTVSCATSSGHGTKLVINSSSFILRVRRVLRFSPTSCCFMAVFSGPLLVFTIDGRRSFEHFP